MIDFDTHYGRYSLRECIFVGKDCFTFNKKFGENHWANIPFVETRIRSGMFVGASNEDILKKINMDLGSMEEKFDLKLIKG